MKSSMKALDLSFMILLFLLLRESNMNQIDISQCFDNISETTLEKKPFFYNDIQTKELCTKLALAQRYKEDIFFPKYFHKCFPLCNSCLEYSKEKNDMKCNSCLNGFRLKWESLFLYRE